MTGGPGIPLPSLAAQNLIVFCRSNNRVCPLPIPWNDLWELLPDRCRVGVGWTPPLPLILAAWAETPPLAKILRLVEHIEWADAHGALRAADTFLRALTEDQWLHFGGVSRTHQQQRRCDAVRKMRAGPSEPAVRRRLQITASCCRKERWW